MPFLTESGLKKLEGLKARIQKIHDQKHEVKPNSPEYSKKMAKSALNIIESIGKDNTKAAGSLAEIKKMVKECERDIAVIDNKKKTGIPTIFNQESLFLAIEFRDFLKKLDFQNDVSESVRTLLKMKTLFSNTPETEILKQLIQEIEMNIQVYETFHKVKAVDEIYRETDRELFMKKTEYKEILRHRKTFESEKLAEIRNNYKRFTSQMLEKIKTLPEVTLKKEDVWKYIDKDLPYKIDWSNIHVCFLASDLMIDLLSVEEAFNTALPAGDCASPMSLVREAGRDMFTKERVDSYKKKVADELKSLEGDVQTYLSGAHLTFKFFQSIPAEKQKIMSDVLVLVRKVQENISSGDISSSLMSVYQQLVKARKENLEFSLGARISPGKCGCIFAKFQPIILGLVTDRDLGSNEQCYQTFSKGTDSVSQPRPQLK